MASTAATIRRASEAARIAAAPLPSATNSPTLASLQRRSAQAIRQADRRRTREQSREARQEFIQLRRELASRNAAINHLARSERKARREDWELGSLAPNRNMNLAAAQSGVNVAETPYGALPSSLSRGVKVTKARRRKVWGILPGDRVAIVSGYHRDVGKIGKVVEVRKEQEEVMVERINVANVAIPDWQLKSEPDKTPFRPMPIPIPLHDVRLVAPLINTETGVPEDVVVEEMSFINERWQNGIKLPKQRFVQTPQGQVEIPYPPETKEEPEYDIDTLRIEVEDRSWTPTLSVPPMPSTIIDELRNKYSKFRTQHDDEWVEARDAEFTRKQQRLQRMQQKMISPLEELQRTKRAQQMAAGEPILDEDVLARIGEVMARNLHLEDTLSRDDDVPTSSPVRESK